MAIFFHFRLFDLHLAEGRFALAVGLCHGVPILYPLAFSFCLDSSVLDYDTFCLSLIDGSRLRAFPCEYT